MKVLFYESIQFVWSENHLENILKCTPVRCYRDALNPAHPYAVVDYNFWTFDKLGSCILFRFVFLPKKQLKLGSRTFARSGSIDSWR